MTDLSAFAWESGANPNATPVDRVVYFESEDAAAIYVDGELLRRGHPDEMTENLLNMLGVRQVQDSAFMLGQSRWSGVATTIEAAARFAKDRDEKARRASELRTQADRLLEEARHLDGA